MPYRTAACAVLVALSVFLAPEPPARALPIGPPGGGGTDPACFDDADCDDGDPCTVGERCVNPGAANAGCLGPTDDVCATTTTSSSTSTSTSTSTTSGPAPTVPTTSTTSPTGATTTTTIVSGRCAAGGDCDDGDPCTADACLDAACIHAPASGLAAATCVCDRPTPQACPALLPRAVVKPFVRACDLARTASAAGRSAKRRLFVRAARKFKAMGARASRLRAKGTLLSGCADRLLDGALQAQQGVTAALDARRAPPNR